MRGGPQGKLPDWLEGGFERHSQKAVVHLTLTQRRVRAVQQLVVRVSPVGRGQVINREGV
ncbi:hypothetical protein ACFSR9_13210 [Deinococcus taklimakanensis]|uniref:Transposase n=1 Tax=Deinococcus taklimakanensis TaxID=536443 RepID=A0ABW5P802_9DEIO